MIAEAQQRDPNAISITPRDDVYVIKFPYNPQLVAAVKTIPGRRWNPKEKCWTVPQTAENDLHLLLQRLGKDFSIDCPDDVMASLAASAEERKQSVDQSRATNADIEVPCPEGLEYLPYQRAGIAYGLGRAGVLIGDEMGLGKTIQAIGMANADAGALDILIICPASLRLNWLREWKKWDVYKRRVAVMSSGKVFPPSEYADVVIINYDIIKKYNDTIKRRKWDILIVDESHYLKNHKAQRTKLIMGFSEKDEKGCWIDHPGIEAKRRIFLTGTPIVNRPIEAWTLIRSLAPTEFPSWYSYVHRYCGAVQDTHGMDVSGASNLDELQEKLRASCMIRRLKKDVLKELPPKRRQIIEFEDAGALDIIEEEKRAFDIIKEKLVILRAKVEMAKAGTKEEYQEAVKALRAGSIGAFTEIARQRHMTAVAKLPYVIQHLKDCIEQGSKIICFAHHKDVIGEIVKEFRTTAVKITGDTKMEDRQAAVDKFQNDPSTMLFVGNIQAAGVGLTLTASSHVVFAELDWVPGNLSQAEDRAHRIGQQESVLVQHLVLAESLDAVMATRLVKKQNVIDAALDDKHQARDVDPILPMKPRELPATEKVRQETMDAKAALITDEQRQAIHQAIKILAGKCDYAQSLDGNGFNKMDAFIGHEFAELAQLTPRQAVLGRKFALKYHRQLDDTLVEKCRGEES